jgi:hypothetical protein
VAGAETLTPLGAAALPRLLARSAAGAAVGCATLHGLLLASGPWGWPATGAAALAVACLLCGAHLWRGGGRTASLLHTALSTLMLAAHAPAAPHHGAHQGMVAWAGPGAAVLAASALALATVRVAWALHRGRGQAPGSAVTSGGRRVPQA